MATDNSNDNNKDANKNTNKDKPFKSPVKHSMSRRCHNHDYSLPGLYMITITTAGRRPLFGRLALDPAPHIELSPLGLAISQTEMAKLAQIYPNLHVRRYCIMPDHIHLIIHVKEPFAPRKDGRKGHLGWVIAGFKGGCRKAYVSLCAEPVTPMFEAKYNDRLILGDRHCEVWSQYLADNPRRLAIKRRYPDYFTVLHDIEICGNACHICGNRFLLNNPDKMAVIVHRADSDTTYREHRRQWLECGSRGGVLVSASIAPREKAVMRDAMDLGYNLILLRENAFATNYKPAGEAFDACASGRLLQISPWDYHYDRRRITRTQCLELNDLARLIADNH